MSNTSDKKLSDETLLGGQGIALLELAVSRMGCVWRSTAQHDAGIDGEIEIRDPATGGMTGLIIKVQSKALSSLQQETSEGFDYWPQERDVRYWLRHNVPVILVVSRPATNEAFWQRVAEPGGRAKVKKFHFSKITDRLDESALGRLVDVAMAGAPGAWAPPLSRTERLYCNLLPVSTLPDRLYLAETPFRKRTDVIDVIAGTNVSLEFILRNERILTVRNLTRPEYRDVCDPGTVEDFAASEWSDSGNPDAQRDFVQLLTACLRQKLRVGPGRLRFDMETDCYYFPAQEDNQPYKFHYQSQKQDTSREVVKALLNKKEQHVMGFRHSAFRAKFFCYDRQWYLEVTPTYLFTNPGGREKSKFHEDWLKRIKEFEKNASVLGQLVMWESLLCANDLFNSYEFLGFSPLLSFETEHGIDDAAWTESEDEEECVASDDDLFGEP